MKLKIEIDPNCEDEILIRARESSEQLFHLQRLISAELDARGELRLTSGDCEFFVPSDNILFFETDGEKTAAHIAPDVMMYSQMRLYELEKLVPYSFVRASKSCLINSAKVSSITRNLTGSSEVHFSGTQKKAYVSRLYYKELIERIETTRLRSRKP